VVQPKHIVFYFGDKSLYGYTEAETKTIYINLNRINNKEDLLLTITHELFHFLKYDEKIAKQLKCRVESEKVEEKIEEIVYSLYNGEEKYKNYYHIYEQAKKLTNKLIKRIRKIINESE